MASDTPDATPPNPPLDWTKLPADLRYLAEPATRYGVLQFFEQRKRFKYQMTRQQREELDMLASRVRTSGDYERLMEWWRRCEDAEADSQEMNLTRWLMAVLNDLVPEEPVAKATIEPGALNWSKLPRRLDYLGVFADSYKDVTTTEARSTLVRKLKASRDEEYERLETVAQSIAEFDTQKIQLWLGRYPMGVHPEADCVVSFLALLRELFER